MRMMRMMRMMMKELLLFVQSQFCDVIEDQHGRVFVPSVLCDPIYFIKARESFSPVIAMTASRSNRMGHVPQIFPNPQSTFFIILLCLYDISSLDYNDCFLAIRERQKKKQPPETEGTTKGQPVLGFRYRLYKTMNLGKLHESKRQRNSEAMVLRSSSESRFGNKPPPPLQSCGGHSATNTVPHQSSSTQQQGGDRSRARRRPLGRLVRGVWVGIVLLFLVSGVVALRMKAWLDHQRLDDEEEQLTMTLLRSRKNGTNIESAIGTVPPKAQQPMEWTETKPTPLLRFDDTPTSSNTTDSTVSKSREIPVQSTTTRPPSPPQAQSPPNSSSTFSIGGVSFTNQRYQLEQWAKQDRKRHRQSAKYRLFGSNQKGGGGDEQTVDFAHGKQVSDRYHQQQQQQQPTKTTVVPDYFTDYDEYTRLLWETTTPDPTRPILAFGPLEFTFGYINQVMTWPVLSCTRTVTISAKFSCPVCIGRTCLVPIGDDRMPPCLMWCAGIHCTLLLVGILPMTPTTDPLGCPDWSDAPHLA